MDKELLDSYVNDKLSFRKAIKNCKTNRDLCEFLLQIQNNRGYKLYVPNKWSIPVEDIVIFEDGLIHCYFYMAGNRTYKSINGLGKVVELLKCSSNYDTFTLTYYNK